MVKRILEINNQIKMKFALKNWERHVSNPGLLREKQEFNPLSHAMKEENSNQYCGP